MRTMSCAKVSASSSIVTTDPTSATASCVQTTTVEASGQTIDPIIADDFVPNTPVAMSDDVDDDGGDGGDSGDGGNGMIGRMSSCAPVGRMSSCAPR